MTNVEDAKIVSELEAAPETGRTATSKGAGTVERRATAVRLAVAKTVVRPPLRGETLRQECQTRTLTGARTAANNVIPAPRARESIAVLRQTAHSAMIFIEDTLDVPNGGLLVSKGLHGFMECTFHSGDVLGLVA